MQRPRAITSRLSAVAAGMMLAAVAGAGVWAAVVGAATESGGKPSTHQYTNPSDGAGPEHLKASCWVTWGEPSNPPGHAYMWLLLDDSPSLPYAPPSYSNIAHASGEAIFTPSGRFSVSCNENGWASPVPSTTVVDSGTCWTARSPTPPAKLYRGEAHLRITAAGDVLIICHGAFTGLWPSG